MSLPWHMMSKGTLASARGKAGSWAGKLPPAMAQGSPTTPQFSGEGHLRKKPCHSCWSRGTRSNLGRGVLLQLLGLPIGGQP